MDPFTLQNHEEREAGPSHCDNHGEREGGCTCEENTETVQTAMKKTPYTTAAIIPNTINNEHHKNITNRTQSSSGRTNSSLFPTGQDENQLQNLECQRDTTA